MWNRVKAKGLTKLRWYCQLCEKPCRDENGYKCHVSSESHLRQVRVFAENPAQFVDFYSKEFEDAFMEVLRRKGENVRSKAKSVWTEVISERHHIHLNATKWLTLTEFVAYLGKEGLAEVDVDEEGVWHIRYINRDPEVLKRKEALAKKEKMDMDDAEKAAKMVENQIKLARKQLAERGYGKDTQTQESKELKREEGEKVTVSLAPVMAAKTKTQAPPPPVALGFDDEGGGPSRVTIKKEEGAGGKEKEKVGEKRKLNAVEEIMMREKRKKEEDEAREAAAKAEDEKLEKVNPDAAWLARGIIVKVVNKKLSGGKYYKKKAVVEKVEDDKYSAQVKVLDMGHVLTLDQEHMETVIPSTGGEVLVVGGKNKGQVGVLDGIDEDKFAARIILEKGGTKLLPYEHVCKLA